MSSPNSQANALPSTAAAAAAAAETAGPKVRHVIWGSVAAISDNSAEGSSSWPVFSGQLDNVTFRDWSGSGESTQSQSHRSEAVAAQRLSKGSSSSSKPGRNSGIEAAAASLDAGNEKVAET